MSEDAWLTITIGSAAVLAIACVGYVLYALRGTRAGSAAGTPPASSYRTTPLTGHRRRGSLRWTSRPRSGEHRSVEDNLARAFERIDAVDPFVAQRRIGQALAEVGLVSSPSVFDEPPPPAGADVPPRGEAGRTSRWEDAV